MKMKLNNCDLIIAKKEFVTYVDVTAPRSSRYIQCSQDIPMGTKVKIDIGAASSGNRNLWACNGKDSSASGHKEYQIIAASGTTGSPAKSFEYTVPTSGDNAFDIKYFYMSNLDISLKVTEH